MKYNKFATTFLLFCLITAAAKAQSTNYSGVWKLNKAQSIFGSISPNSAPVLLEIKQDDKAISIKRKQLYASGDSTVYTEKLTFDGKPVDVIIKGDLKKKTTIKWSADNSTLSDVSTYSNGSEGKENWLLSKDGKILTFKREFTSNGQTTTTSYVYDKN